MQNTAAVNSEITTSDITKGSGDARAYTVTGLMVQLMQKHKAAIPKKLNLLKMQ